MTPQDFQAASNGTSKRKVALITGITGQVTTSLNSLLIKIVRSEWLGWKLSDRISSRKRL